MRSSVVQLLVAGLLLAVTGCSTPNAGGPSEWLFPDQADRSPSSRLVSEMCSRLQRTEVLSRVLPAQGFGPGPSYDGMQSTRCIANGQRGSESPLGGRYDIQVGVDSYGDKSLQEFRQHTRDEAGEQSRLDECERPAECWYAKPGGIYGDGWGVRGYLYPYRVIVHVKMAPTRSADEKLAKEWAWSTSVEVLREALVILADG